MIDKKIYKKLKEIAKRQGTISYSQFASDCGKPYNSIEERNQFHHLLGEISKFEVSQGRPMLSVLVHHKMDIERTPGKGFFELAEELGQRKSTESNKEMRYRIIKDCWKTWKE